MIAINDRLFRCALELRAQLPRVFMPEKEFMALPEYSLSVPTRARIGRRWRKNVSEDWMGHNGPPVWVMGEYIADKASGGSVQICWHKWGRVMNNFFRVLGGYIALPDEWEVIQCCRERGVTLADYIYSEVKEGGEYAIFEREDGLALAVFSAYVWDVNTLVCENAGVYYPSIESAKKAGPFFDEGASFGYGSCAVPYDLRGIIDIAAVLDSFIRYRPTFSVASARKQVAPWGVSMWMCSCADPDCRMNGCKYIRSFKRDLTPGSPLTGQAAEELRKLAELLKPLPKERTP